MRHKFQVVMLALFLAAALTTHAAAQSAAAKKPLPGNKGYPAVPLLSTGKNILGETIYYPTTGPAHITAAIVTLAPGAKTIVHKHGVPLFAFILDGELTVDYGSHGKRIYKKGQAFMEAMAVAHYGINTTTAPVRILAVYMGAKGAKNVIAEK